MLERLPAITSPDQQTFPVYVAIKIKSRIVILASSFRSAAGFQSGDDGVEGIEPATSIKSIMFTLQFPLMSPVHKLAPSSELMVIRGRGNLCKTCLFVVEIPKP